MPATRAMVVLFALVARAGSLPSGDGFQDPAGPHAYVWEDLGPSAAELVRVDELTRTVTVSTAGTLAGWRCQASYRPQDLEQWIEVRP